MVSDQGLRATLLLLALTFLVGQQLVDASKIAYKKPLYGKLSHFKDRRVKQRTTSSPTLGTTQEADWPAPVEFIINSSTAKALPQEEQLESSTGSSSTTTTSVQPFATSTATSIIGSSTPHPEQEELEHDELQQESELGSSSTTSTPGSLDNTLPSPPTPAGADPQQPVPCTCGVFLTSQIKNGLPETPLIHNEMDRMYPCNAIGRKQCQTKCLETIVQHLPNSANIVCSALGHNCHKERAYLFIKNCQNVWVNTNLQAGREYCCKEGQPYRCPLLG
ncbi:hypothetical protein AWZ03_010889 [Drosophila navojoa]|uniref:Follicle cell protein 3C-1 n=1 Tax=Drosophila navojoa TaxID=7232 RepID=A0A484B4E1_DRONA|nr:follicle cell protein 3C-1 [Drosophila navojoa]TDG42691.1 hypothetical protein AWZ03_010889 [Drosophila navojoa]